MAALTTSELNKILIDNGCNKIIELSNNKWNADFALMSENEDGKSFLALYKNINESCSTFVTRYSNLKASDKKELVLLLLS